MQEIVDRDEPFHKTMVPIDEARKEFDERGDHFKVEIMEGIDEPEHGKVIDICTTAALRELTTPALLAVLMPVVIGFGIGYLALGAFLGARRPAPAALI